MRLRLILSFVLIVLVSITSVVVLARSGAANEVRAFMFRGGMTDTNELVSTLEDYYLAHGSWENVEEVLHFSGKGRGMGQSGMGHGGMSGMFHSQRLRLAGSDGTVIVDTSVDSVESLTQLSNSDIQKAIPLKVNSETVGYLLAESSINFSVDDESFLVNRLSKAAFSAGIIAAAFSLLLAFLLAYNLMRPVRELTQAARGLGEGNLSTRVKVHGSDELALLGRTFNQMAASLQQAQESRKAMTADIAHELRNPLAVQRANLEALQDGVIPLSSENFDVVLKQNLLLTQMVEDLRTLALADIGQLELESLPTDLNQLLERVVEAYQPNARDRQITLSYELLDPTVQSVILSVDPIRIEQILNNLLTNAMRFTPAGGRILVSMSSEETRINVSVQDSGPGISTEALPHVFDRFYRADRSRSRSEGGSGLGLTIARYLAEAHRGSLTVSNHPGGGAIFTLILPKLDSV